MKIKVEANAGFKEVDRSKKRYIVMKGSAGSGKSMDTAQNYIIRLMNDPGRNLLCVRKADVTNRDSTFAELQSAIFRMFGENYKKYWYINTSNMLLECKNNHNQIIFRGVNDEKQREKLKSITFKRGKLTDVWIEEATEITQSDFEIIDDRLRGILPKGLFYQIRLTFNPVSSHHWIKKVFFDRVDPDVLTHQSTYENNRFIDEAYHRRMLRRKEVDPEGYRVYGLGEWGEVAGLILKNYVIEEFDRNPENYDYIVNSQDFGFNHANCIGEVGFKDGDLYLFQELYVYEMDTEEIIKLAAGRFNKKLRMWCDSAEPDRIKMWQKAGYRAKGVNKETNSVHAQIDYLKQHMIHIHPSCVNTIKEIQQWKWKKDERTNTYLEEPVPFFDDAMAMLRYSIEEERKLIWEEEEKIHGFDGVPATEYVENKERTCIFEPAISMIDAYNKAISEKANDVDYFADAYMKVLGSRLDDDDLEHIRDKRIINLEGDADTVIVDFLQKPNGDTTQENLIDRLEKLIFQISMVANISDENFGTSSGIAMKYKLQGMSNLAKTKERKFTSGMNRRYKLIFSNPVSGMKEDDWVKLHYHFTPNIPSNVLEESQIAGNLDGIVSQETQLGVLSVVDNVQNEMEKIESEQEKAKTDPVMTQMFGGAGDGKPGVLEEPGNGSKET